MELRKLMTDTVIHIHPEESVAVAARLLEHYNIGALPVCSTDGTVCGVVTDRDLVTRCLAGNREIRQTKVGDIMSRHLVTASPDTSAEEAARLMGREQIRRLPVVSGGKLCGMVSLGDLSHAIPAGDTLSQVSSNLSSR